MMAGNSVSKPHMNIDPNNIQTTDKFLTELGFIIDVVKTDDNTINIDENDPIVGGDITYQMEWEEMDGGGICGKMPYTDIKDGD